MLTSYSLSYLRYIPSELSQVWTYTIPDFPEFYRRITLDPFSIKPNKILNGLHANSHICRRFSVTIMMPLRDS